MTLEEVRSRTGFALEVPPDLTLTRPPSADELAWIEWLDPSGRLLGEVPEADPETVRGRDRDA